MKTPCEFFVWYLIPTIRREIVNLLIKEFSLSQKEIADLLGLTKSAVSQYVHEKRGEKIKLDEKTKRGIRKIVEEIAKKRNPLFTTREICVICRIIRNEGLICNIHKKFNEELEDCKLCMR